MSHEMPKFTPVIRKVDWVPTKWTIASLFYQYVWENPLVQEGMYKQGILSIFRPNLSPSPLGRPSRWPIWNS